MNYKLIDEVFCHEEEGKAFAINANTSNVFELNDVAKIIVENLEKESSYKEICTKISERFSDIDEKDIREDVDSFMQILVENQFVIKV